MTSRSVVMLAGEEEGRDRASTTVKHEFIKSCEAWMKRRERITAAGARTYEDGKTNAQGYESYEIRTKERKYGAGVILWHLFRCSLA